MMGLILICCAMVGDEAKPAAASQADRAVYETAKTTAGKDARAHVDLALWCEAHRLTAERVKHLALAIAYDPANTLARGLSGLVAHDGKWQRPEEFGQQLKTDPAFQPLIHEYLDRRVRTAHKADAQLKLAAWCAEKGLKEQALAHYSEVTRIDPSREIAWKHLGYKKQGNHWIKPADAAAQKLEAERQKHADSHWKSRLEKLREELESSHATRRAKAEAAPGEVTDPRAVSMIWKIFANGSERAQLAAVQLLGQIEGPASSNALAALAVFSPAALVRGRATETLARRDPRDVVGRLITLIRRPFKYKVVPANGPGSSAALLVDGESFDLERFYHFPKFDPRLVPMTQFVSIQTTPIGTAGVSTSNAMPRNTPGLGKHGAAPSAGVTGSLGGMADFNASMIAQTEMMMAAAMMETIQRNAAVQQSLENDIQTIEAVNAQMNQINDRVLPVIKSLTGQELGPEPESWRQWWTDQLGYVYQSSTPQSKPTFTETVGLPDVSPSIPLLQVQPQLRTHSSCFAAGTLVHTIDGPKAIESIQLGDRVLAENTTTGALAFQPVVATHVNDPSPTLRIAIDGETIVATGIHRFWIAGKGWTMARDLKAGDRVRMVDGVVEILSIGSDSIQPVYNLDVAEDRDFFVGKKGLLAHDFSFVQPVVAAFDRMPD